MGSNNSNHFSEPRVSKFKIKSSNTTVDLSNLPSISDTNLHQSSAQTKSITDHGIVIVKGNFSSVDSLEMDEEILKLKNMPNIQLFVHEKLNSSTADKAHMSSKLYFKPLFKLCHRYQTHLKHCREKINLEQNYIIENIRKVDYIITVSLNSLEQRQKRYIIYVEQFRKIQKIYSQVMYCEVLFADIVSSVNELNNMLPSHFQLEPFLPAPSCY